MKMKFRCLAVLVRRISIKWNTLAKIATKIPEPMAVFLPPSSQVLLIAEVSVS